MKKIILIIVIFLILGLAAGAIYFWQTHKNMQYVAWEIISKDLQDCQVAKVDQTHGRLVYITLKNGQELYSLEPTKNRVIDELVQVLAQCGDIDLKTN